MLSCYIELDKFVGNCVFYYKKLFYKIVFVFLDIKNNTFSKNFNSETQKRQLQQSLVIEYFLLIFAFPTYSIIKNFLKSPIDKILEL